MKKNKILLFVAMFAAAILFLAACGNNEPSPTVTPDVPTTPVVPRPEPAPQLPADEELEGTITFSWWGNDGRHNASKEIAELFMDENPGVTILFDYGAFGGWQDHITTSIFGGVEADVMQLNFNWLQLFSPFGTTFADLEDPVIAQHLDLSNWNAHDLDVTRRNGVLQGVPAGMTARVPFMRRDIFEAAGLNIQEINTWDELMEAGQAIQAYHGEDTFALSPLGNASLAYMVFSYLEQLTGRQFVDENNQFNYSLEELTQAFTLVQRMLDNGVLAPPSEDNINQSNPRWIGGHYGGVSEWDSSINGWIGNLEEQYQEYVGIRPHFTMEGAQNSGWLARPSLVWGISNDTQHPDVAAAFLEFMLTDQRAIEILGTDRGVPINQVGRAHFDALNLENLVIDAVAMHQNAETVTFHPMLEFPNVREIIEQRAIAIQAGEATVEEAAQFVYDNLQAAINEHVID